MCMAHEIKCSCGAKSASFHFRDNLLPVQVVTTLYCPACSQSRLLDPTSMVADNGWVIVYDMDIAMPLLLNQGGPSVTPQRVFDEGYCTWNGMYPGDHIDSVREREAITALAKTDPQEYLHRLKTWAVDRMERLNHEGWRKAKIAV